jgi:ABC-type multidrug transport system permease subunit
MRAALLIFLNEFRLLVADLVGLFMLLLAPIMIITVAGFSLGNLYGAKPDPHTFFIPIIDNDRGPVATALIKALRDEPSLTIALLDDRQSALRIVGRRARTPVAVLIPAGTSERFKEGGSPQLEIYIDPVKRLEVSAIELRLNQLTARLNEIATKRARQQIISETGELQKQLRSEIESMRTRLDLYRQQAARSRSALQREFAQRELAARQQMITAVEDALSKARADTQKSLAQRRDALLVASQYLVQVRTAAAEFKQWFAQLQAIAGTHAAAIPPPPTWPTPPSQEVLAELSTPFSLPLPKSASIPDLPLAPPVTFERWPDLSQLASAVPNPEPIILSTLPGTLGWRERSFVGGPTAVNAFDQYVPGFGITFLLIGMLMGLSMGLIDDRDWGTLARLQVSGAPLPAILIGKVFSRLVVGFVQLVLLFAAGWWLFGISLGRSPAALLLPALAIAFAAAAFGLIVPCFARTHDSVMPVGAVASMTMSAIGGCWWPLDFEPSWMRELALWLPTTWTMRAFNDLMIRNLVPGDILSATLHTAGLGSLYLVIGLIGVSKLYRAL